MAQFAAATGTTSDVVLVLAVFAAAAVEMVEALTIVVAVGATRGWRSALQGAAVAVGVLALLVAAGGIPLIRYVPIDALRVGVGALMLLLGLSWLRKAVLRSAGILAEHDENAIYADTVRSLRRHEPSPARRSDVEGFGVAFKGVFLEGVEVVIIVVSLGASQHRLGLAAASGSVAVVVVAVVGALVARQLAEVPENLLKLIVGVLLVSFGTFWVGEGAGVHWPASDASMAVLVAVFAVTTVGLVAMMRRSSSAARHSMSRQPVDA